MPKEKNENDDGPAPGWKRLTASRIFYAFEADVEYVRTKITPYRFKSLLAERQAADEYAKSHRVFKRDVLFLHPIEFWAGCIPDAIVDEGGKLLVVEVKAIFLEDDVWLNEMGDIYDPKTDHPRWLRQLQYSLWITGADQGELVIWKFDSEKFHASIRIDRDPSFAADHLSTLQNFYLREVFFDNVSVKTLKKSFKGRLAAALRQVMEDQIAVNLAQFRKKRLCCPESYCRAQIWGLMGSSDR